MIKDPLLQKKNKNSFNLSFNNQTEDLLFHVPSFQGQIHPHYTILVWLLTNLQPEKIAIFDNNLKNTTQKNICEIINFFELYGQCYSNDYKANDDLYNNTILPIESNNTHFDFIYINSTNQSIQKAPILSQISQSLPKESIVIIDNIYNEHSIAKENYPIITDWQTQYLHFEFPHQNGITILYTGHTPPAILQELFDLNHSPVLAQRFKKKYAFIDQFWSMYNLIHNNNNPHNSNEFLEAKIEQNLLKRKIDYLEKQFENQSQQTEKKDRIIQDLTLQIRNNQTQSALNNQVQITPNQNVLFVAGEPDTPGVVYRCHRNAKACVMAGHNARVLNAAHVNINDIQWADVIILWRVEFSGHIDGILKLSKEHNVLTAFDADDIVFKPHFAHIEIIDGIRSIGTTEAKTAHTFHNMRQTLMRSDFAIATTKEMREHMAQELIPKHAGPLIYTLPNVFDDECVKLSRLAARIVQSTKDDAFVRIGYAAGTRTHQRDFSLVIPALISIFQQRPNVRLVLFREPENHRPILHMNEYPELKDYENFIEWRDTVPLEILPQELARFDISIAPLEPNNVFCNAKSELKYFEAALANVCSVVSPTKPLKRCIQHSITGFFASTPQEWEKSLLTLIDNESLRKQVAQNAYHSVLWNFSIQRQSKLCDTMLLSLANEKGATQAAETIFSRKDYHIRNLPDIPPSDILFNYDNLKESDVTVVITSYNYQHYILEALESVSLQTLKDLDLIIVDDGSSDDSIALIMEWATHHKHRFNRLQIHKSVQNVGLGGARNIGIAASETLYSMQLDADNRLMPDTCEKLLNALQNTNIGYAYPQIQHFEASQAVGGHIPFNPLRLTVGNYIDAMTLIAKWAWAAAGGFYVKRDAMGWEDFDMWCSLAEMGIAGKQVTNAIAEYRAHFTSMTNVLTEQNAHKPKVVSHLENRHPWLDLVYPEVSPWVQK